MLYGPSSDISHSILPGLDQAKRIWVSSHTVKPLIILRYIEELSYLK